MRETCYLLLVMSPSFGSPHKRQGFCTKIFPNPYTCWVLNAQFQSHTKVQITTHRLWSTVKILWTWEMMIKDFPQEDLKSLKPSFTYKFSVKLQTHINYEFCNTTKKPLQTNKNTPKTTKLQKTLCFFSSSSLTRFLPS